MMSEAKVGGCCGLDITSSTWIHVVGALHLGQLWEAMTII